MKFISYGYSVRHQPKDMHSGLIYFRHVVSFGLVWVKHVKCLKHSSPLSIVQSVVG